MTPVTFKMSGLEVVGLVLGAIPITIEILRKLSEEADNFQNAEMVKIRLQSCSSRFITSKTFLVQSCKEILKEVMNGDEVDRMSEERMFYFDWNNSNLDTDGIRHSYGSTFEVVMMNMENAKGLLEKVNAKLGEMDVELENVKRSLVSYISFIIRATT